jgi:hypothetical protein
MKLVESTLATMDKLPLRPLRAHAKSALLAGSLVLLWGALPAHAETVILRNGQSLSITGYEQRGDALLLHVSGGVVTVPAAEVERIEPQEDFAPNPAPSVPPLEESIRDTAERYRLDPNLLASVIAVESGFDPRAISRKNARGLMQLMPGTSAQMGVADVFAARQNLEGGARYLRQLLDRYHQDVRLALAAYNAGPGAVDRVRTVPYIPETRQYVYQVLRQWNARAKKAAPPASQSTHQTETRIQ